MKFCIITHVIHSQQAGQYFAYAPYVNEMNVWSKYADEIILVSPLESHEKGNIHSFYQHKKIINNKLDTFNLLNVSSVLLAFFAMLKNSIIIYKSIKQSDHIHLRCPGNIGLLGCIVQIFFPSKIKTAKYAGNWDPKAEQPLSYKIQKWILSNTFLTKNMKVLVYGDWPSQTVNIKPFFTATYREEEKKELLPIRKLTNSIKFLFVGTLSEGKQPLYAIKLVQQLSEKGFDVSLQLYGEGVMRHILEDYIESHKIASYIHLRGNQNKETLKQAYQTSHFLVLPSKSEGWPKAVAESMFWGCLPVSSNVSCVSNMLDSGGRGVLLTMQLDKDVKQLQYMLKDQQRYVEKVKKSIDWSQKYTMDFFEEEIQKMILA